MLVIAFSRIATICGNMYVRHAANGQLLSINPNDCRLLAVHSFIYSKLELIASCIRGSGESR